MNLDTFPQWVWLKLARYALGLQDKSSVRVAVDSYFYQHIYETWSQGKVTYEGNLPTGGTDVTGWKKLVQLWKNKFDGKKTGKVLKDQGVGVFGTQSDGNTEKDIGMTRLWEHYNDRPMVSRFQFVVTTGGGMVLFNRMRRACQQCILDNGGNNPDQWAEGFCISGWKVFGEEGGKGRSDSCVVYLADRGDSQPVLDVVDNYIWPAVRDVVSTDFVPLGFYMIGDKPLWTMPFPSKDREIAVLGETAQGSAGGLMGLILGKAYAEALDAQPKPDGKGPVHIGRHREGLRIGGHREMDERGLAQSALAYAKWIVGELYTSRPVFNKRRMTV